MTEGELMGAQWALLMHNSLQQATRLPPGSHLLIRYEDLVLHRLEIVSKISEFLDQRGDLIFDNKLTVAKGFMLDVWKDRLSLTQQQDITRIAASVMTQLGYTDFLE